MTKNVRGTPIPPRRDRLIRERRHDPYRPTEKFSEPVRCPDCGAEYRDGRWRWSELPATAPAQICPACQRIRDGYPAGFVTLRGAFFEDHRDEILALARNLEERAKAERPLIRIMDVASEGDATRITTTDLHLARTIGDAIHRAYQGELDYEYSKEGDLLRVRWSR